MCSKIKRKGVGTFLIGIIENMCKKLSMPTIFLRAIGDAIPFYTKLKFVKYNPTSSEMCVMTKSIKIRKGGKKEKQKYQNKNKKTRKNRIYNKNKT
jgi:hypothetical protein